MSTSSSSACRRSSSNTGRFLVCVCVFVFCVFWGGEGSNEKGCSKDELEWLKSNLCFSGRGGGGFRRKDKSFKKRGMNKKRPRDPKESFDEQLCRQMLSTGACTYGPECVYMHDLAQYAKMKEKV